MNYREFIDLRLTLQNQRKLDIEGYYEIHHILPKFMGGTDYDGIILLTLEEHIRAHLLLAEENKDNKYLYYTNIQSAYMILFMVHDTTNAKKLKTINDYLCNPHKMSELEKIKREYKNACSEKQKLNMPIIEKRRNKHTGYFVKLGEENKPQEQRTWVNNGIQKHYVKNSELKSFLNTHLDFVIGKGNNHKKYEITQPNYKNAVKGKICITNGKTNKYVTESELQSWLDKNWIKGSFSTGHKKGEKPHNVGFKTINNGIEQKTFPKNEIETYLKQGWVLGMLDKNKPKNSLRGKIRHKS